MVGATSYHGVNRDNFNFESCGIVNAARHRGVLAGFTGRGQL
jgi:hypothetical protein